uniref:Glycoprotein n=1 Tax=Panagrellus redivivus TaxID=6233 RepID=A0A7E4ZVX4_PANRE
MTRILKRLLLFAFVLNCLTEDQCDEDCILQKSNSQLSTIVHQPPSRHKRGSTVYVYGINTCHDKHEFELLDGQNFPDLNQLTEAGRVCSSVTADVYRHGVIVFTGDKIYKVMDVFVFCTLTQIAPTKREEALEKLILNYIINTPPRVLGDKQYIPDASNANPGHCLDEDGFITDPIKIDNLEVTCFTFISATNTGAYLNNRLMQADVDIYAGPLSVNRINQTKVFQQGNHQDSVLAIFYQKTENGHKWFCDMYRDKTKDDSCYVMANQNYYGTLCCCQKEPSTCGFHIHQDPTIVCATGELSVTIKADGSEVYSPAQVKQYPASQLKVLLLHKECVGEYSLTDNYSKMKHVVTGVDDNSCSTLKNGEPLCTLRKTICPTIKVEETMVNIKCCCRNADLCNIDFTAVKAFERLKEIRENKVCDQLMLYSFLFTKNYTIFGNDEQVLCPVQYDPSLKKTVDLQTNNNMNLLRDVDYRAYRTEGCTVVAALIMPVAVEKCANDVYTMDATKIPRPIVICTCKGLLFNHVKKDGEAFCDVEMKANIEKYYKTTVDAQMPKCLHLKSQRFDEYSDLTRIIDAGEMILTEKYIFCYAVINQIEGSVPDLTAVFNIDSGVASIESGYSHSCFDLYNKASADDRLKPLCDINAKKQHYCCSMALERETAGPRQLLFDMQDKIRGIFQNEVVKTSPGYKKYKNLRKTHCLSSLNTQKSESCTLPMGCFWTESSISNRVSTEFQAGCISRIPEIVDDSDGKPGLIKALRTCLLISAARRSKRYEETKRVPEWYLDDTYDCFATNQKDDLKDNDKGETDVTSVFVVCCCTELSESGECTHDEQGKKDYGVLMPSFITKANNYEKDYAVPL